jgi:transcriptional regulator with XRE-family HTH domain
MFATATAKGLDVPTETREAAYVITRLQCRAARATLEWTRDDLAREAGVSVITIKGFESGKRDPQRSTLVVIQQAFERGGIEFLDGDGVRLRRPK